MRGSIVTVTRVGFVFVSKKNICNDLEVVLEHRTDLRSIGCYNSGRCERR